MFENGSNPSLTRFQEAKGVVSYDLRSNTLLCWDHQITSYAQRYPCNVIWIKGACCNHMTDLVRSFIS